MFLYRWIWKNLQGYRAVYIIGLSLTVICQSMYIIAPYFSQIIVDTFIFNDNAMENVQNNSNYLILLLVGMVGFTLLRTIIFYSAIMCYEKSSQGMIYKIKGYIFDNLQSQDSDFYSYYRTGDIMTRLTGDMDMVRHSISWVFKTMLESLVLFTVTTIYFFYLNPLMALSLLALTPIIFIITYFFRKNIRPLFIKLREQLSQLSATTEENIAGNRVVKAFSREEFEKSRFDKRNNEYMTANKITTYTWMKYFPYLEITAQTLTVVHLLVGGLFVINGGLTFGEFTAFSALIWTISNPMRMIGNLVNDLQRFTASASKVIEIYYSRSKIVDRVDAKELAGRRLKGDIEFKNVSFKYGNKFVLKNINFKIKSGQTLAIMGETGSGKTTLINLIPRLYDVNGGAVILDGIDVRLLKLKDLRYSIGVATQDVLLFSDTVEGNIAFGDVDLSLENVKDFAALTDSHSFIERMQEGYDTIVGERGIGLSGGQKQRISLARALAIKPSVLILDDTTSAVDLETERKIQDSLNNLDFECTKIIIAQRISSTKNADKIIILRDGEIVEEGTHDELVAMGGYYSEVYDLQK